MNILDQLGAYAGRRVAEAKEHMTLEEVMDKAMALPVNDFPFERALKKEGIALIPLVGPNTNVERMQLYTTVGEGYVYVVSVMGVTGVRESLPPEVVSTITRARSVFRLPLALGFGLREKKQLDAFPITARPDAVVFGSALLRHLEEGLTAAEFMARWH